MLSHRNPRLAAESFAWIRRNFPDIEDYEETPEDMIEFFDRFREVYSKEIDTLFALPLDPAQRQRMLVDLASAMHVIFRWARYNMPVFQLTRDLAASLILTDVEELRCVDVQFPFPTFCIQIPPDLWNVEGSPIDSLWVHRYIGQASETGRRRVEMLTTNTIAENGLSLYDTYIYGINPFCLPGEDSEDPVKGWLGHKKETKSYTTDEMTDQDFGLMESIKRLVLNVMMYVAEKPIGDPRKPRRKYTKRARQTEMDPEVWVLGTRIKMRPELIDVARASGGSRSSPSDLAKWRLKKRIAVKGHWRRQPFGPRGTGQWRWKWIAPYLKGEGPRYTHIHEDKPVHTKDPFRGLEGLVIKKGKKKRRRRRKNPMFILDESILQLEHEADEAAELAEEYYDQEMYDEGDYFCNKANSLFDELEQLTGEVYE